MSGNERVAADPLSPGNCEVRPQWIELVYPTHLIWNLDLESGGQVYILISCDGSQTFPEQCLHCDRDRSDRDIKELRSFTECQDPGFPSRTYLETAANYLHVTF